MAIVNASLLANNYFVMDMPDVQWTGLTGTVTLRIIITPLNGAVTQITETYVPDNDGAVTLRGLSEMLQPYVSPSPTELAAVNLTNNGVTLATVTRASVGLALFDSEGNSVGSSCHCYVYYSNQKTDTYPGSLRKWLSRYTDRPLFPAQRVTASAFLVDGISAKLRVHYVQDGAVMTADMAVPLTGSAEQPPTDVFILCYALEYIAAAVGCDKEDVKIVDVLLMDGQTTLDTIRYRVDLAEPDSLRIVAFTNCYGMFETEPFTGTDERSDSMEGEYSWIDNTYEKISEEVVSEHRLCAGHISEEQRRSIGDIAHSPKVAIVYKGNGSVLAPAEYEPMTVTGIEINDKQPHTEPQTAYVTLRHAPRRHEVASRGAGNATYDDGIFDYTFDDSYN